MGEDQFCRLASVGTTGPLASYEDGGFAYMVGYKYPYRGDLGGMFFHLPITTGLHKMSANEIEVHRAGVETPPSDSKVNIAQDHKRAEMAHLEKQVINRDTQFVVRIMVVSIQAEGSLSNQDENLVRAENEDKVTPYLVFLIAVVSI